MESNKQPGMLSEYSGMRLRPSVASYGSSGASSVASSRQTESYVKRVTTWETLGDAKNLPKTKRMRNDFFLQIIVLILCFLLWVTSVTTFFVWVLFVHASYYLKHIEDVGISSAVDMSFVGGILGGLTSAMMFCFAVEALSYRKSPKGEERQTVLTLMMLVTIGITLCALVFCFQVNSQFTATGLSYHTATSETGFDNTLEKSMQKDFIAQFGESSNNKFWDIVQLQLGCCGVYSRRDWQHSLYFLTHNLPQPISCCTQLPDFFGSVDAYVRRVYDSHEFESTYYTRIEGIT